MNLIRNADLKKKGHDGPDCLKGPELEGPVEKIPPLYMASPPLVVVAY
jgi:hypothetical protein